MATIAQQLTEAREVQVELRGKIQGYLAKAEGNTWNEETDKPGLNEASTALDAQNLKVKDLEERLELQKRSIEWTSTPTTQNPVSVNVIEKRGDNVAEIRKAFRITEAVKQASSRSGLEGMYAEMDQEGKMQMRAASLPGGGTGNLSIPDFLMWQEKRDITATTTTTGGHTIQTDLGDLIPFLDPTLAVKAMGATYLSGLTGNVAFPRNDAAATAVWASSENASSTETTPTFDQVTMSPKRVTAFTDVSKQNLVQTNIAMENFVRERLNFAVMKLLDYSALQGDGTSGAPTGLFSTSGLNDIAIAGTDGGPLDWSLIVQFETETATDNALMNRLGYLTTPGVAGYLKGVKRDVAGNGFIWEGPNTNATVNGYRAMVTTQMPSTLTKGSGTNLHGMIFGNWAELLIGQWGGVDLLVNPYTKGKEALIEFIINAWYDIDVRHAASFCKCDEIDIS